MSSAETEREFDSGRELKPVGRSVPLIAAVIGITALALSLFAALVWGGGMNAFLESYHLNYCYVLSLALGALFFVMLQHATRAGWSVAVRRIAECIAACFPLLVVLALPILFNLDALFDWTNPETAADDPLIAHKSGYLNMPFLLIRLAVYFLVWIGLSLFFLHGSTRQDASGDTRITLTMGRVSAPGLILLAVTLTFAAFDLIMSLDPHWFSTIFGVYYFAGSVISALALIIIASMFLQSSGRLVSVITTEHYHDLGKLLFAFIVFWAYIGFSQYMLIWYANIPEETQWFLKRQSQPWIWLSLAVAIGHFLIPFVGLISRYAKRKRSLLLFWSGWMLVMHWLDLYWLMMPEMRPNQPGIGLADIGCGIGLGALFLSYAAFVAGRRSLVPARDPRLADSLGFINP